MAPRSPQLEHALRAFTLGAFAYLLRELEEAGETLPFAFEEHEARGRPALYEYRPLVRDFVEVRADRLRGRDDALIALEELAREPAAGIYARAHAGRDPSEGDALFRTVLVDLLIFIATWSVWLFLKGPLEILPVGDTLVEIARYTLIGFAGVARAGYWARAYRALGGLSPDDGVPGL